MMPGIDPRSATPPDEQVPELVAAPVRCGVLPVGTGLQIVGPG